MGALCCGVEFGEFFRGRDFGGEGQGMDVFGCALMRALAVTAVLPCTLHLKEVT